MNYHIKLMRSATDGDKLFAHIGRFLASPQVREELGGYPINDSEAHAWLVAIEKRSLKCVGFLSYSEGATIVLHDGFIDGKHRGKGVFREMLRQVLALAEHQGKTVGANVQKASAERLRKLGFAPQSTRGNWVRIKLEKS